MGLARCNVLCHKRGMTLPQLKQYRIDAGLTQQEAGQAFGVARETWAFWESGHRKIGRDKLASISEKTGIPKRDLRPDLAEVMREAAE